MRARALRRTLEAQRDRIEQVTRRERRTVRTDSSWERQVVADIAEQCESDVQSDLDLALLAIHAELLQEIDQALSQLDHGTYGRCLECGSDIPERRLGVLPSATRCTICEEAREAAADRETQASARLLASELGALPA
jgi:RNA polymerase-binding transcription factor DksA